MANSEVRVYIGNIVNNYDVCLEELRARFAKVGQLMLDDFERHENWAYMNIKFYDAENGFNHLKRSLNNINFKGNQLRIDIAKPKWEETWAIQHEQDVKEDKIKEEIMKKKEWEHYKKIENIKMDWRDRKELIPGRKRKTPRSKAMMRNITFRVNVEGSLKVYKCYKNKLWGYERNRTAQDLVSKFVKGKWWNDYSHIVDRLDYSRSKQSIRQLKSLPPVLKTQSTNINNASNGITINNSMRDNAEEELDEIDEDEEQEKAKYNDALNQVLSGFDFSKTINVVDSDEAEQFGFSEGEGENHGGENAMKYTDDYSEDSNAGYDGKYNSHDKYHNQENGSEQYNEEHNTVEEEKEFIPSFGHIGKSVEEDNKLVESERNPVEGTISNTETLRALFNPDDATATVQKESDKVNNSFKLIHDNDDDIDHDKIVDGDGVDDKDSNYGFVDSFRVPTLQNRLFFPHFQSPFLVGQTQLSHIQTNNSTSANELFTTWEDKFWDNRGVWMKEMKNKKRDALRQQRKRRSKDGSTILI